MKRWWFRGQSAHPSLSSDRWRPCFAAAGGRSLGPRHRARQRCIGRRYGSQAHVAAIGPTGESQVRYASIVADRHYQAMRLGVGAVMGAKRLEAVALVGGSLPPALDPEALAGLTTLNVSPAPKETDATPLRQKNPPGFAAWVDTITDPGYLSVENFRSSAPPNREAFAARPLSGVLPRRGSLPQSSQ